MPIYAYRCSNCGFQKDVLQKISDPRLTTCPSCGQETYVKQLTAAGFQLKGSGWYVTDFRDGGGKTAAKKDDAVPDAPKAEAGDAKPAGDAAAAPAAAPAPAAAAAAPAASPAPAPAASPGTPPKPAST
jgi:putative FmdB family regulatory protein